MTRGELQQLFWFYFRMSSSYVFHPYNTIDGGKVHIYHFPHLPIHRFGFIKILSIYVVFTLWAILRTGHYLYLQQISPTHPLLTLTSPLPMKKQTSNKSVNTICGLYNIMWTLLNVIWTVDNSMRAILNEHEMCRIQYHVNNVQCHERSVHNFIKECNK